MIERTTAIIVNKKAGRKTRKAHEQLESALNRRGYGFHPRFTRHPGDANTLAQTACRRGVQTIIGVGGDGTLNEIVNGILAATPPGVIRPSLGVVPAGSGCDFAKTLRISRNVDAAVARIFSGRTRRVDVGRIGFRTFTGAAAYRYFLNVLSFGVAGEVVAHIGNTRGKLASLLAYARSAPAVMARVGKRRFSIGIDGQIVLNGRAWNVAVANGRFQGAGMQISPFARPDDGRFHVTLVGDIPFSLSMLWFPLLYVGKIHWVPGVSIESGKRIEAVTDDPAAIEADGERIGRLPAVIDVIPRALDICM